MKAAYFVISFGVLFLPGCNSESTPNGASPFAEGRYAHVVQEINGFLAQTLQGQTPNNANESVKVGFTPKQPSEKSQGQRILVIDAGMRLPAYTRYKSRVLDDLEPDDDGVYRSVSKDIELPRGMVHILSSILDERHPDTPALALDSIAKREVNGPDLLFAPDYSPWHGDMIFATLADLNPEAEFVIAQLKNIPHHLLSKNHKEEEVIALTGHYLDNLAESLIATIKKYDINFVNMSFGETTRAIRESIASRLAPELDSTAFYRRILRLLKERFYERLFSLKDIVFVQAAASSASELDVNDEDFSIDCAKYSNRIRAGFIEQLETDVPKEGAYRENYLSNKNTRLCTDLFFNSGVERGFGGDQIKGKHPYFMTSDGIGATILYSRFTSSWATPFVLSYLNFRKQEAKAKGEPFSVAGFVDSKYIIEPFKYGLLEIFRTGRL